MWVKTRIHGSGIFGLLPGDRIALKRPVDCYEDSEDYSMYVVVRRSEQDVNEIDYDMALACGEDWDEMSRSIDALFGALAQGKPSFDLDAFQEDQRKEGNREN